jgi:hypothetical protein
MASKSPLAIVKERFGDKAKLVEAVQAFATEDLWLGRTSADRGRDKGLAHVSNAKLLRLHATFSEVKEKFGTRAKLIDEILALGNRTKDQGYRQRLDAYPVPRLYDLLRAASKRAKQAKARAAATKGPAKAESRPTAKSKG